MVTLKPNWEQCICLVLVRLKLAEPQLKFVFSYQKYPVTFCTL